MKPSVLACCFILSLVSSPALAEKEAHAGEAVLPAVGGPAVPAEDGDSLEPGGDSSASETEPTRREGAPLAATWKKLRLTPFLGVSVVGLAGLEDYSDSYVRSWIVNWQNQGMAVSVESESGITWALVDGVEAALKLDPQVTLAARLTRLATESASRRTVLDGNGDSYEDAWTARANMTAVQAGAGFDMDVSSRLRLNAALFVGAGFASVSIMHRVSLGPGQLDEFAASGSGVAFIPEFSTGLDLSLTESLSAGLGLGYRFGSVGAFENSHATSIRDGTSVDMAGSTMRDQSGKIVQGDFGGPVLRLFFTALL